MNLEYSIFYKDIKFNINILLMNKTLSSNSEMEWKWCGNLERGQ